MPSVVQVIAFESVKVIVVVGAPPAAVAVASVVVENVVEAEPLAAIVTIGMI